MAETIEFCNVAREITFEKCSDRIDNDGNGFTDCDDFSCRNNDDPTVAVACLESLLPVNCEDGLDNDADGFTDCDDWDCTWNPRVTACVGPRVCE